MTARLARTVSSLLAAAVAVSCTSYFEIPIETPIRPKLDVSAFNRVLVAGFLSGGTEDVDANLETVRLLRSQLRTKSELRVIDARMCGDDDHEVDGRRIQGWFIQSPASTKGNPAPAVLEIHGGPATLYGWSLMWEWQVMAANGMSVYACNPRGSQGYGQAFLTANVADWGDGPMREVMGGIDSLVADGLVDPNRMGVTGGSYGGYLTSWIVGHTDRFKAAVTSRSVNDMVSQMLSGDIGGPTFGLFEYGVQPWEDWDLYRRHSPLTYAEKVTTPLLIQHSEQDLRCTITQAEELFAVLRSLRRTVRLMRVPDESHELTRSGTPFRRVDNLRLIDEWFRHFLVEGKTRLPRIDPRRG